MDDTEKYGQAYEAKHVHEVYEEIADHFSGTRYKPWPIVERFLQSLPDGSVGLDIGCGNGKYLLVNRDVFIIASDRSSNLVRIAAKHAPHAALVADTLSLPHRAGTFDFAISIAMIHHLSTTERRVEAIAGILELLMAQNGKALIYVWALEQRDSRRGWDKGEAQDVLVPWVLKDQKGKQSKGKDRKENNNDVNENDLEEKVYQRYYHLFREGELEDNIVAAGGTVLESGYEKDNWWAIAAPANHD
ncbi:S-adenosyl-L-methionine-dependent methyltransferase [Rhizodiscina lignyota]|uniref:S-adenosyl-L-methionine-dependent methyltransferase n=1 Tax=Rhizodiscina lignyota TaxID=1504668 RepID=A0A9P4IEY6_9PEZI|nr:S-adenosyl-L-methionine-dependent methyltransferase [Rhizodiscina lignyota]